MLNGDQLSPVSIRTDQQEQKLRLKFERSAVQEMVSGEESPAMLNVGGELNDGMEFIGADTIKILHVGSSE
jgi:hypothetical protein